MTASAMISGKVFRDAERKTSKSGKPFATATIMEGEGDAVSWWRIITFNEAAIDELMALKGGDGIAASGGIKVELYEKNGEKRIGLTIFAERVMSAQRQKREPSERQPERHERAPQDRRPERPAPEQSTAVRRPGPDDEIPF